MSNRISPTGNREARVPEESPPRPTHTDPFKSSFTPGKTDENVMTVPRPHGQLFSANEALENFKKEVASANYDKIGKTMFEHIRSLPPCGAGMDAIIERVQLLDNMQKAAKNALADNVQKFPNPAQPIVHADGDIFYQGADRALKELKTRLLSKLLEPPF